MVSAFLNTTQNGAMQSTFDTAVDITSTGAPFWSPVAIGDFNGDGAPDLAVQDPNTSIAVLLNTTPPSAAMPTFSTKVDFTTGVLTVAVEDFNGDGRPDLVASNGRSLSVLLNTTPRGDTTPNFATHVDFAAKDPLLIVTGDFNGDGRPDVAAASNDSSDTVSVLLNFTGPGATTPVFAAKVELAIPPVQTGVLSNIIAVGDLNGDERPDLAVKGPTLAVISNTTAIGATTPTFVAPVGLAPKPSFPAAIAVGDFNADGKLDLAATNLQGVSVLLAQ